MLPWQVKALAKRKIYKRLILSCGVLSGKTSFGAALCFEEMSQSNGETFWWLAPEEWQIGRFREEFVPKAALAGWRIREFPTLYIETPNGTKLYGVTAKNLNRLSAYHPRHVYVDEAAKMTAQAWNFTHIRMVKAKTVVLMSTPRPSHWKKLVERARRRDEKLWGLLEVSTEEAGLVTAEEIDEQRRELPEWLFRQEFMAEIVDAGQVFPKIREAATLAPEGPKPKGQYQVTQDVAKHHDFGVITVWKGMNIVHIERLVNAEYRFQAQRAAQICVRYNQASLIYDQTGVGESYGEMVEEECEKHDVDCLGVVFTAINKGVMVNAAIKAFEDGLIGLIDPKHGEPYTTLVEELLAFERRRSTSGLRYSYEAPAGGHDDTVTTILLRMAGVKEPRVRTIGPHGEEEVADAESSEDSEDSAGRAPIREGPRDRFLDDD